MKLVPQSLRARLMLLLIGVLLLAQLLSFALHFRDRGEILRQVAGYNLMQRIAGMVNVLDGLSPAERAVFVRSLDLPPLRISLRGQPADLPDEKQDSVQGAVLHRLLHFRLGEDRKVMVYVPSRPVSRHATPSESDPFPNGMRGMMARHMGWRFMNPAGGLMVQLQLSHGQWAFFRYQLPEELLVWPWGLLAGLLVLLGAVLVVSLVAVRWITRPLSTLASAADQLGKDLGHAPLPEDGPLEVRRAAAAFNTMQQRLARFVDERTRILTAVSHDLKTPITRMRLRLEGVSDLALRARFDHDLLEMQAMVQSSLDFMRGISIQEEARPLDVNALAETLCEDAADAGEAIQVCGRAVNPYKGRPMALRRAIGNLLENAIRYGTEVEVGIEDSPDQLRIAIRDRGPGLPGELLEKVFEPFFRAETSRNLQTGGTGLGLSIARNIAQAQGGELRLRNRPGGGLEALLILPR